MQVSLCLFSVSASALVDQHPIAARVLLLGAIFLVGYAEAAVLKSRGVASITWLLGLAAACLWIVYPVTPIRVVIGLAVFLCGVAALIIFYSKKPRLPSNPLIRQRTGFGNESGFLSGAVSIGGLRKVYYGYFGFGYFGTVHSNTVV